MLNIPPGCSIDVPPGFTKAHCKLQIEAAAVSYADAPSSLILDAPPGFFTRISLLALLKLIADYLVHLQWEKLGKQMK